MTRVQFYTLGESDQMAQWQFACRLVQTIVRKGHLVYLLVENQDMAARLDEQLWTFQEDSFVPHTLNPDEMADCPVGIGHDPDDVRDHHDCLINLTPVVPRIFSRFETTVEIVTQAPDALAHSRARYRFYQNRGYDVRHIDMRTRH